MIDTKIPPQTQVSLCLLDSKEPLGKVYPTNMEDAVGSKYLPTIIGEMAIILLSSVDPVVMVGVVNK